MFVCTLNIVPDFDCHVVLQRLTPEDILECYRKEVPKESADEIGVDDFSDRPDSCFDGYDDSFQENVVPDSLSNSVTIEGKSDAEFPASNEASRPRSWKRKLKTYRPSKGAVAKNITCGNDRESSESDHEESEDDDASEAEVVVVKKPRRRGPGKKPPKEKKPRTRKKKPPKEKKPPKGKQNDHSYAK